MGMWAIDEHGEGGAYRPLEERIFVPFRDSCVFTCAGKCDPAGLRQLCYHCATSPSHACGTSLLCVGKDAAVNCRLLATFADQKAHAQLVDRALNVYDVGGAFKPHEDMQSLTVLVPVTTRGQFEGGGTAFWSLVDGGEDAAVQPEPLPGAPPNPDACWGNAATLVLTPLRGSAILFCGHMTHAAQPVTSGRRVVFVASFSASLGGAGPQAEAKPKRDLSDAQQGDLQRLRRAAATTDALVVRCGPEGHTGDPPVAHGDSPRYNEAQDIGHRPASRSATTGAMAGGHRPQ